MRLFSIVSLIVFCLYLTMVHGQDGIKAYPLENVAANAKVKECKAACQASCAKHCPVGSCGAPVNVVSTGPRRCITCLCPSPDGL